MPQINTIHTPDMTGISKMQKFTKPNYTAHLLILVFWTSIYTFFEEKEMCKVIGCNQAHQKHFCRVCKKNDVDHRSRNCPEGTIVYHGTKRQFSNLIQKNGFKPSQQGRIGAGVYFTFDFEQAKKIAKYRYPNSNPVVIECMAVVDYRQFRPDDSEQEMVRKFNQWYDFCKKTANKSIHPPWANNEEFRQVCVKDHKAISIRKVYDV